MKTEPWLLLLVLALAHSPTHASAAAFPACASAPPARAGAGAKSPRGGIRVLPRLVQPRLDRFPEPTSFLPQWRKARQTPFHQALGPDAGDDPQADGNLFPGASARPAGLDLGSRLAEWRLTRPDRQQANSFIHSKTEPPP